MKIIVVGCGKIGTSIISELVNEGHDVTLVDNNPEVINEITNIYDIIGICGNGADSDVLREINANKADLIIAVTNSDEINVLCCYFAKVMGAKNTIARIRNPDYNDRSLGFMKQHLKISLAINPEFMAAQSLFNILKFPSAVNIETFSSRNFEMIELVLKPDSALNGLQLKDLRKKFKEEFLICAVQRGDEVFIPDGNFCLNSGDKLGITASQTEIQKLFRELGILQKQARRIMILGGGTISLYLAKMLTAIGASVIIVDKNLKRCSELTEYLPKAVIVHGDGAHQEVLLEEGLLAVDAFIALTGKDEENILISSFAASQNVPKVITKVNRDELASIARQLGLDSLVSPKKIIADSIVKYARALQNSLDSSVETLYRIMDDKVEIAEFIVKEEIKHLTNIPFKELKLRANTLIGGIIRDRATIIPNGNDVLMQNDRVIVLTSGHSLHNLSDVLR